MSFASLCVFTNVYYSVNFLSTCRYRKEQQRCSYCPNIIPQRSSCAFSMETQRSSCAFSMETQRSSCAFSMETQRSSCGLHDSCASDPQLAARSCPACGRKKKFLRVHYVWAVLYFKFVQQSDFTIFSVVLNFVSYFLSKRFY